MSRPKSPAGSKASRSSARGAGGRASSRSSSAAGGARRVVSVPQAQSDIYTALLGISLTAILTGCVLLALVLNTYEFKLTP